MSDAPSRLLLLFLDGVGLGEDDPGVNPFARAELPTLGALLGGDEGMMIAADARLGVPGLPQSGTGQTALLTGVNAAERMGRHFGPWVPTALREMLAAQNLLSRAAAAGRRVAFANAYPEGFLSPGGRG
ncbi:MAG TPA: hypothetical protein VFI96_08785, partial [Longimicrobiaceae bacterium]|nr:hypothetical protein [Longimicrobiaceae bacterium]